MKGLSLRDPELEDQNTTLSKGYLYRLGDLLRRELTLRGSVEDEVWVYSRYTMPAHNKGLLAKVERRLARYQEIAGSGIKPCPD
jgi:hypothetical protein